MEGLKQILDPDKLQLIKILVKELQLGVNIGETAGIAFKTNIGTPQGDVLTPPVLFRLYLARAMSPTQKPENIDHTYFTNSPPERMITSRYADDINWIPIHNRQEVEALK